MMRAKYWNEDDILEVCSDKPIAREVSEHWHVHKSYAADGELVAVVFLDAVKEGYFTPSATCPSPTILLPFTALQKPAPGGCFDQNA